MRKRAETIDTGIAGKGRYEFIICGYFGNSGADVNSDRRTAAYFAADKEKLRGKVEIFHVAVRGGKADTAV